MQVRAEHPEFTPPQPSGFVRSLVLALLAHALLLAALTWGVNWRREAENLSVEAELWATVPRQAAPRLEAAPPPPPAPRPQVQPPPPQPAQRDADIALEREKKRREDERQREQQARLLQQKKAEAEADRKEAEKKRLEAREKQAEKARQDKREADAKRKAAEAEQARVQQEADEKRLEAQRQENLKRMQGLAEAKGPPTATGTAAQSAGPSDSYAGRIRARIKPNIVFMDDVAGNPTAEVEVRAAPDGTIVSRRLVKSSGVRNWDEAVLKAIDKTEVLPRDVDGRVPPLLLLNFKPKDLI